MSDPFGLCDTCGWRYPLKDLRKTSYNTLVCPTDFDGAFDLKNHPQNFSAQAKKEKTVKNPRPETNRDRDLIWENANINWEDLDAYWNTVDYGDL